VINRADNNLENWPQIVIRVLVMIQFLKMKNIENFFHRILFIEFSTKMNSIAVKKYDPL